MILMIGGYAQGKLNVAKQMADTNEYANGECCNMDDVFDHAIIYQLHLFIKRLMKQGMDPIEFFSMHAEALANKIIISDEIGLGIVPMDGGDRHWREVTGRVCCMLAEKAEAVYRVYAGIPIKIKGT